MRQKLTLITLGVKDFKLSVAFYESLGWVQSPASMDGLALFPLGGIVLSLHPMHELAEDATVPEEGSGFRGLTLSLNAKSEKEVEEVLEEVKQAGGTIAKPAQKVYWGGYHGYFQYLDGNLFEVAYNPFWELDENNNIKLPA